MARSQAGAHAGGNPHPSQLPTTKAQGEQRILGNGQSSLVGSIAQAVVIKDEDLFFLCERDGRVPLQANHGVGLYFHDCRFLNGYELYLADAPPSPLGYTAQKGFLASLELANPDLKLPDGSLLPKEDLGLTWERVIDASRNMLFDRIAIQNYQLKEVHFPLTFRFGAAFEDIFIVRGMPSKERGELHPPAWKDGALQFAYDGRDGLRRTTTIRFAPAVEPDKDPTTAHLRLSLRPRETREVLVAVELAEVKQDKAGTSRSRSLPDFRRVITALDHSSQNRLHQQTAVQSDSPLLDRALDRSLRDLRVLRSQLRGHAFFAAGVPWYVTLFGRDSLISALQSLAYEPAIAEQTLRLLASYQGKKVDEWRDEEPGKIMHELRVGEMARTDEIPQTPYYGTIDATPLFLILLSRHAAWTGSLALFEELRDHVEKALTWIAKYGDPTGTGYLAYQVKSKKGLGNQGWKDSGDAIVNADGSLAQPPIALAEVQGYVYLAKTGLADLYRRAGDAGRAGQLLREATDLKERFNRDFWLADKGVYALALQAGGRPAAVVASNVGQVLWSGIADPDKARQTQERLMAEDMFSGWGIRTLAAGERRYNPVGYHLGTVWPHDNSLILAGFRQYGFDEAARRVFGGILDAATHFHVYRLPEVFAGFSRAEFPEPVHYPVACHPQAWAAGTLPFMLADLLGLVPDAWDGRLRIVRPVLPNLVNHLELHGLRVGAAHVNLRFEHGTGDRVKVKVLQLRGKLDVVPESGSKK